MSEPSLESAQRVHLVGIGGSGMGALAGLLLQMGKHISGSDSSGSAAVAQLGARVFGQHAAANVGDAEYVVRSSAVADDNVEVQETQRRGLPLRKLADAVGELMRGRSGVAIAGTHGKTTTTALVTWLLECGGLDPLALIGADAPRFSMGARLGSGPMVVEADEYDRRFLSYWPEVAVVTSIEADHLDYYRDVSEIREAFQELVSRVPAHGRVIVSADERCAASLVSVAQRDTYGVAECSNWRVTEYAPRRGGGSTFSLTTDGRTWSVESPLVGEHNACNVAAAIAVADYFGVGLRSALAALPRFEGPRRRFESKGKSRGVWIVDDYAHHPTEVAAVLRAARGVAEADVWVVFQPHTTNRTAALLEEFSRAFDQADHVLVLPIFRPAGRELAARHVTSSDLVARMRQREHADVRLADTSAAALEAIAADAQPGDLVLTMGAGDVTRLSDELVRELSGSR
ncbi:MAG: UDP-N-acetylmuramate--L-alanine ligase [Chloroflexi bacterium]|nr:UDP-N-acetylmuramate--L-alanine ligase [Chloroflexota bacterium]